MAAAVADLSGAPDKQLAAFGTLAGLAADEEGLAALAEVAAEVVPPTAAAVQACVGSSDEAILSAGAGAAKLLGAMAGGSAAGCMAVFQNDGLSALAGVNCHAD